jgi:hypothetical protein
MESVLVLYHATAAPLRAAIADHLNSIRRYSGRPCIYINVAARRVPRWVHRLDIGLVVFHTTLLATRWHPEAFHRVASRLDGLDGLDCPRVAIPQDEFLNTDPLVDFLRRFGVSHVFTCAPSHEWETIYGALMADGVGLTRVLTGYLEPRTVRRISQLAAEGGARSIDVGYRSWQPEPWLGRHGMLKGRIAELFTEEGRRRGLRTDISMRPDDTLLGDAWYRFLLSCRFTIGAEGGASILDRDGRIRDCVTRYRGEHPQAAFEEIEASCFPGLDGTFDLRAISPRHLEACATRTPQILVEGSYNGILEPGTHYIPLRADFRNISAALDAMTDRQAASEMAERAYRDVVASGRHGYESFVSTLLAAVPQRPDRGSARRSAGAAWISAWAVAADRGSWALVWLRHHGKRTARSALRSVGLLEAVKGARSRWRSRKSPPG